MKTWKTGDIITANDMNNLETFAVEVIPSEDFNDFTLDAMAEDIVEAYQSGRIVTLYSNTEGVHAYGMLTQALYGLNGDTVEYNFHTAWNAKDTIFYAQGNTKPTTQAPINT